MTVRRERHSGANTRHIKSPTTRLPDLRLERANLRFAIRRAGRTALAKRVFHVVERHALPLGDHVRVNLITA